MAKDDYFVIVCKILCYLYDCLKSGKTVDVNYLSCKEKQFNVNESYWKYIIENIAKEGYVRGVIVHYMDNETFVHYDERIQITPKGIEYLQENSTMKRLLALLKTSKI